MNARASSLGRRSFLRRLPLSAAALAAGSTAVVQAAESGARTAIDALNRRFEEAHLRGDAAALAAQYTRDAEALWGPDGVVTGRAAIEKLWKGDIGQGGRKVSVQTREVQEAGDWAYETGRMVVTGPEGAPVSDSMYIVIWRREDGQWRIHRDIGGENRVAQAAAAAKAKAKSEAKARKKAERRIPDSDKDKDR